MTRTTRFLAAPAALALLLAAGTTACRRPSGPPGTPSTTAPATTTTSTGTPSTTGPRPSTTVTTAPPAGVTRVVKKYGVGAGGTGSFRVPDRNSPGMGPFTSAAPMLGATVDKGTLWNQPVRNVPPPCTNCYITRMQAGLEFATGPNAGKPAVISNGMWLHHMVLLNSGPGRSDPTCAGSGFSLPHIAVGGNPSNTERIFASGNERTVLETGPAGKYGYKVNAGDQFGLLVELMNETDQAQDVVLTMTYDYVPASAAGYRNVKPIWLDAAQCGTSEVPAKTGAYTVSSKPWPSTVTGTIVGAGGHVHDGGYKVTIARNGQVFCDSKTLYDPNNPDFKPPAGGGHEHGGSDDGHGGAVHITGQEICYDNLPALAQGDTLQVNGYYDDAQHPQMVHDGKLHSVMAIAVLYVAQ